MLKLSRFLQSSQNGHRAGLLILLILLGGLILSGCGQESPTVSADSLPFEIKPTATPTPPFAAASNITATATPIPPDQTIGALLNTSTPLPSIAPTATPTLLPTPIFAPTPATPQEGYFTADDFGLSSWTGTELSWSPQGDQFVVHITGQGQNNSFYYLIRPPNSHVADYKFTGSSFSTIDWSPDGRYFSFVDEDASGGAGPIKVVDTLNSPNTPVQVFKGPCTSATWLKNGKLAATCGLAVYNLSPDTSSDSPPILFSLQGNHFPNSNTPLALLARAVPSPDGSLLALLALRSGTATTQTDVGIYNLNTKAFTAIDHNNRSVTFPLYDVWTPDSKYIVLRNFISDTWAVPYTFDFYLADVAKGILVANLTRTNPTCDPLLAKADCQGINPSTQQSDQILFAPDSKRYIFTTQSFVSNPGADLQSFYRLFDSSVSNNKLNQVVQEAVGDKIENMAWLNNNHYFYTHQFANGTAKPILDGVPLQLKISNDKAMSYYASPTGNWLASVEKIGDSKAAVQYQLRLIPVNLK